MEQFPLTALLTGLQVLVEQFWLNSFAASARAGVGGTVLVEQFWWDSSGGTVVVEQFWWNSFRKQRF